MSVVSRMNVMGKNKVYKAIHSMSFNSNDDADLISLFNEIGRRKKQISTKAAIRDTLVTLRGVILDFLDRDRTEHHSRGSFKS